MKRTLAILGLLALTAAPGVAETAGPTQISVTGTGSISMMPDQASVNASVVTTASSATQATDENNRRYNAIIDAVTKLGISRSDITLSYYTINYVPKPQAPATPQPYERYGYTVSRSFDVKVRKMTQTGSVVDALSAAGVTNVGNVSFGLADPHHAQAQAMQRAVADARAQADALASAAGLHVVRIVTMSTGYSQPVVPLMMKAAAVAAPAAAPTELDAGSVNVTSNVSVTFAASP